MGRVADGAFILVQGTVPDAGFLKVFRHIFMATQAKCLLFRIQHVREVRCMGVMTGAAAFRHRFVFIFEFKLVTPIFVAKET